MTTRKLLWGMTWRGMALGTEYGAVLGFLYGLLILLLVFGLSSIFPSPPPTQIVGEQIELDASVFFIGTLLSSFAGFVVGISTGLTIGLIGGVSCGIVTRLFFLPLLDPKRYYCITQTLGSLYSSVGTSICIFLFFRPTGMDQNTFDFGHLVIVFVSALISGICGILISRRIAQWYERESAKGIAQNVSPN